MKHTDNSEKTTPILKSYHRIIEVLHAKIGHWEGFNRGKFTEALRHTEETIHSWETESRKEAEKLLDYLKRDLQEAARVIARSTDPNTEWRQWLKFDLEQIEQQTLEKLFEIADSTQLEWLQFQDELESHMEFHAGEIKSIGTLQCTQCNKTMHFNAPKKIPACPECQGTTYRRTP